MDKLNPHEYLSAFHKKKYLALLAPISLVVLSFIINHFFSLEEVKYLALAGLLWYLLIFAIYKINKPYPPAENAGIVYAPLNGKIFKIAEKRIFIRKHFWHPVDIRNVSSANIEIIFPADQPVLWEGFSSEAGKLIGFKAGKIICEIVIPDDFSLRVSTSQKVIGGQTILAEKEN